MLRHWILWIGFAAMCAAGSDTAEQARALYQVGETAMASGDLKAASANFEKALKAYGKDREAAKPLIQLSVLKIKKQDWPGAQALLEKAMAIDPSEPALASLWMGVVQREKGKFGFAEMHFWEAVLYQDPKNAKEVQLVKDTYMQLLARQDRSHEAQSIFHCMGILRPDVPKPDSIVYDEAAVNIMPRLLVKVSPRVTAKAKAAKANGTVTLKADVHLDGRAHNITVTQPLGHGLDETAIEALRQWRLLPGLMNGKRVVVTMYFTMNFTFS